MKRMGKHLIGAVLKIDLQNGHFVYGRILANSSYAIYDSLTREDFEDLEAIISKPVLFIVSVYDSAIKTERWKICGQIPLEESLKHLPMKCIQDSLNPDRFDLYNPNTGEITKASREQCEGLETAAVWAAEHVEDRIRDFYLNVPNRWVEQLKIT